MYHGVAYKDLGISTQVPLDQFELQMAYLEKNYKVQSLDGLVNKLKENKLPSGSVAVTFDDGYKNNASLAYPVLQRNHIPATIFITTGFVERDELYNGFLWTDYIYILLNGCNLSSLDLSDQGLEKFNLGTHEQLIAAKVQIYSHLKRLPDSEKQKIIKTIKERTGDTVRDEDRELFGPMSWEQICSLQENKLVAIGAHTVRHPILSKLDLHEAEQEIVQSKLMLEQKLNSPINAFAYPSGGSQDINNEIVQKVSENFAYALSTDSGFNDKNANLFALRRIGIGNAMPLWYFKMQLSGVNIFLKRLICYENSVEY